MNGESVVSVWPTFPLFLLKSSANLASLVAFFKSAADEVELVVLVPPNTGLAANIGVPGGLVGFAGGCDLEVLNFFQLIAALLKISTAESAT